ncbi:MAG: [FeFe] hydrogenase H-cluster radical SAM maturase HydE [Ignavibacteriaceae bacterium]
MNLNQILNKEELSREEIFFLLSLKDNKDIEKLYSRADEIRKEYCGDEVHLRGIIEFSNYCDQNCLYCGLQKSNKNIHRYRMTKDEIISTAAKITQAGIKTVVLQSGEDHFYSKSLVTDIILSIKEKFDPAITLSIGERGKDEYEEWKNAGADRYLLKHETANEHLYSTYHQHEKLKSRLAHIQCLKKIGYQTGSGNIIGLPGQTTEDIADDILLCKELDCDMCSFSPFIPSNDSPFRDIPAANVDLALKTNSVARIVLKNVHIPATTALSTLMSNGAEVGLKVGANVIMPNFTPFPYRENYKIYKNKKAYDPLVYLEEIKSMLDRIGRKVGEDKGQSLKLMVNQ